MKRTDLPRDVLERRAIVYVRQSTGIQVKENLESKHRQYALVDEARAVGFTDVVVIDDDLGRSASGAVRRPGFESVVAQVCGGGVGAVFCLEASRLARNGRDWHRLIELCGIVGARVIDADAAYDPSAPDDRLVLGLKGTMSEFELTLLRKRLVDGTQSKASRGELRLQVPVGFRWTQHEGLEIEPDRRVQDAIRQVFALFERFESARKVLRHMSEGGMTFPRPDAKPTSPRRSWLKPSYRNIISVLQNPFYAGAYAYGKTNSKTSLVDGHISKTYGHAKARDAWTVLIRDHHVGFIDWATYERNQELLRRNAHRLPAGRPKSGRGGRALLSGLLRCARCGRMLGVAYNNQRYNPRYACRYGNVSNGSSPCISFGARRPDDIIGTELLRVVAPLAVEAAAHANQQIGASGRERQRALELECEQAKYDVRVAARRYEAVDPDNRLVAVELETRWNEALARSHDCDTRLAAMRAEVPVDVDVTRLATLAHDLSGVWKARATKMETKQRLVRALIEEIVVDTNENTREVKLIIHWKGGQHSDVTFVKPKSGEHTKLTSAEADKVIREMAGQWSDEHIAATLNRMAIRTAHDKTWNVIRVGSYRRTYDIAAYASAASPAEWVTMRDAVAVAGVSSFLLRALIRENVLPARQVMPDAPWQIRLSDLNSPIVRDVLSRRRKNNRPSRVARDDRTLVIPGT